MFNPESVWPLGTRLRKKSGSSWHGTVVGYYSTDLTPNGVAVESEREPGSVQIYPVRAMEVNPEPSLFDTIESLQAQVAEIAKLKAVRARPRFPILGAGVTVDLGLVQDHGKQARANHYQTVERLAERGGLSWCELHAVLNSRAWQKMDENQAIQECRAIEAAYLAALGQGEG